MIIDIGEIKAIREMTLDHVSKTPITESALLCLNKILEKDNRMVSIHVIEDPDYRQNPSMETTMQTKNITFTLEQSYSAEVPHMKRNQL